MTTGTAPYDARVHEDSYELEHTSTGSRKETTDMPLDLDWNSIRALNGSKRDGFEELCTQLARADCPPGSRFERKGTPDSGVEAYVVHPNQTEWAWQAK